MVPHLSSAILYNTLRSKIIPQTSWAIVLTDTNCEFYFHLGHFISVWETPEEVKDVLRILTAPLPKVDEEKAVKRGLPDEAVSGIPKKVKAEKKPIDLEKAKGEFMVVYLTVRDLWLITKGSTQREECLVVCLLGFSH